MKLSPPPRPLSGTIRLKAGAMTVGNPEKNPNIPPMSLLVRLWGILPKCQWWRSFGVLARGIGGRNARG
jgi:hypothetical protein